MDRLTAIRVFVETAERGSMTATADALGMSKPMVSRYLDSLEAWLGARLFHRTTRRLALTGPGEKALKACKEMLELAGDMRLQASEAGEVQGRLRLTSSPSFAHAQLTAAVVDFQALHPKVEVDLVMLDRTVDLVQDRIDLAIRLSNRIDEGLVSRKLAVCRSVLCAAPGYLQRAGVPQVPEDLAEHRCITHSNGLAPSYTLRGGTKVTPIAVRSTLTANETSIVKAAALAGAGIAMLPTYYVGEELKSGALQLVMPAYELDTIAIQAVYLSRRHQPLPLRLLIDFFANRFGGEQAPWDK